MDFWHSIGGMVAVTVTSASTAEIMSAVNQAGITVYDAQMGEDELTVHFQLRREDLKAVRHIANRKGAELSLNRRIGMYWTAKGLLKRPVLLAGLLIILLAVAFLPTRIFFFRVEGNESIPTKLILEKSAACGITFGASRSDVRSEKVKNALLEAIPELKWAGVNTSGCVATISVRERSEEGSSVQASGVSSIIALREGIITECTVTKGNAVCKPGQAVRAGQVLISGYTDCGISIRAEQAQGEVYAETDRELRAVLPDIASKKGEITGQTKKYSLVIGKKRINLYKDSGISDSSCDKMYVENYITLPGGFQLPVAIVTEVWTYYACETEAAAQTDAESILSDFSREYLSTQMIAGSILSFDETVSQEDGYYCLSGKYACSEMIGLTQNEEIITPYGKHD